MGHDRDDTSVNSPAGKPDQHHLIAPAFEHVAFLVALGFVAGFVDIFGFMALFAGLVLLVALLDSGAGPEIVTWPLLLAGSGLGMMASQLGSVTVSAVPDEQSGEVGGLQNTGTQLGASIGTALAGAVLMRAMAPFRSSPKSELAGTPVLILSGLLDPIVPAESAARLAAALAESGANVQRKMLSAGHGITEEDLALAAAFLDTL